MLVVSVHWSLRVPVVELAIVYHTILYKHCGNGEIVVLIVHVDYIILLGHVIIILIVFNLS